MLGDNLRCCRKRAGLKQRELGELIGVDSAQISAWETGRITPRIDAIKKLCAALTVDPGELIKEERNGGENNDQGKV